jgi:hypothetical protein
MKSLYLAAVAAIAFGTSAQAAIVVDQSSWLTPSGLALSASGTFGDETGTRQLQVQSFTAGMDGKLTKVDLQIWRAAGFNDLNIGIARGIVGTPSLNILGILPVARLSVPTQTQVAGGAFLSVDVSSLNIIVHPGQTLSIGVLPLGQNPCCNVYRWTNGEFDADGNLVNGLIYGDGFNQISVDGGDTWSPTGLDRSFRTWVDTSIVPEPASWAMMISGFGLVGFAARRRRAVVAA